MTLTLTDLFSRFTQGLFDILNFALRRTQTPQPLATLVNQRVGRLRNRFLALLEQFRAGTLPPLHPSRAGAPPRLQPASFGVRAAPVAPRHPCPPRHRRAAGPDPGDRLAPPLLPVRYRRKRRGSPRTRRRRPAGRPHPARVLPHGRHEAAGLARAAAPQAGAQAARAHAAPAEGSLTPGPPRVRHT